MSVVAMEFYRDVGKTLYLVWLFNSNNGVYCFLNNI